MIINQENGSFKVHLESYGCSFLQQFQVNLQ